MSDKIRTDQQRKALFLMFKQLAQILNDSGIDFKSFPLAIDVPWSAITVKEIIWKRVSEAYCQKESTKNLTTDEINKIFEVIILKVSELTGQTLQFPSIETLMTEKLLKD